MSQIDLKNAKVIIRDGYSATAAVNNVAGYSANATTMTIDGFTGAIETGIRFTIASDSTKTRYKVTAHTETTGNTTSITFTPGLAESVADNDVINVLAHELEVTIGEGTLTFSEKKPRTYTKNRGALDTVRNADEEPLDVKLDATWDFISSESGATTPTFVEALKRTGAAAAWTSSSDDTCEPYAVNIEVEYTPECSDVDKEYIILPDFRYEQLDYDAKAGTISVTGKCNSTEAIVDRVSAFVA